MSLDLTKTKLPTERSFGITVGIVLLFVGTLQIFLNRGHGRIIFVVIGVALFLLALVYPTALIYPNRAWFKFGILLNRFVSPIVIGIFYFFILTPFSITLKLFSKFDPLKTRFDTEAKSYWIERNPTGPVIENSRKQF